MDEIEILDETERQSRKRKAADDPSSLHDSDQGEDEDAARLLRSSSSASSSTKQQQQQHARASSLTKKHAEVVKPAASYARNNPKSPKKNSKVPPYNRETVSEMDECGAKLISLPQSARNGYFRAKNLDGTVWEEIARALEKRSQPFPFNKWRAGNFVPSRQVIVYGGKVKVLKPTAMTSKFLERRSQNLSATESKKHAHTCGPLCIDYDDMTTDESRASFSAWLAVLVLGYHRVYALERFWTITRPRVVYITPCGTLLVNEKDVERHLKLTKSLLPQQLFVFDPTCDPTLIFVPDEMSSVLMADISNGLCRVPVSVVALEGKENFERARLITNDLCRDFRFIKGAVFDRALSDVRLEQLCMCDCVDGRCGTDCSCKNPSIPGFDELTTELYNSSVSNSVNSSPFYYGRILQKHMYGIFECASTCSCRGRCPSTICADHLMPNLQIFMTEKCGFGVRVLHDIPSGSFVCSYDGVICEEEAFQDGRHYPYTLSLDYIEMALGDEEAEKYRKLRSYKQYTMDAEKVGGVARFFNHSCNPNLFIQNVFSGHRDPRFPRLAFITGRCVYAGEELTWNYGYQVGCLGDDKEQQCFCGSEECAGRLF